MRDARERNKRAPSTYTFYATGGHAHPHPAKS
jgi:hypothetical protein